MAGKYAEDKQHILKALNDVVCHAIHQTETYFYRA